MLTQKQISKLHNGLMACSINEAKHLMPEVVPVLKTCPKIKGYLFDVKVHMLKPGMRPCIGGWHCDFVPRDENGTLQPQLVPENPLPMYLLISGEPLAEFEDHRLKLEPWEWLEFNQRDSHRGHKAEVDTWRLFVRAAPIGLFPSHALGASGIRRHSQVYLTDDFNW